MSQKRSSLLILFAFLLTGCSVAAALPTKTATPVPLTASPTETATNTSTATLVPPTVTNTPTVTIPALSTSTSAPIATSPSPDALAFDKYSCEPILEHLPANANVSGTIILVRQQNEAALLNVQSGEEQQVDTTGPNYGSFSTSPNGKHFAYIQFPHNSNEEHIWLIVKGSNGQQEVKIAVKKEWPSLTTTWLDNERLIFSRWFRGNEGVLPAVVFNPFTGQEQTLPSENYPGITADPSDPAESASGIIDSKISLSYDPSLNLVFYNSFDKKLDQSFINLWDRKNKKTLAKIGADKEYYVGLLSSQYSRDAIWSSNKNVFYFLNYSGKLPYGRKLSDWFSIDPEGNIKQLTHFSNSLTDSMISNRSLSPDGRHLAFWLNPAYSQEYNRREYLVVLDLETLKTNAYCVPNVTDQSVFVWSPDSQYVATTQTDYTNNYPAIVLSIQDGWLAKIAKEAFPEAWWGGSSDILPVLATP